MSSNFDVRRTLPCAAAAGWRPPHWRRSSYPAKPITFIVPFAAGSATDQLARALGQSISRARPKQPVVVDNKPGASGFIAAQAAPRPRPTATRC